MARLLIHVEGETEAQFVDELLRDFLVERGYSTVAARLHGNARQKSDRGGGKSWESVRREIIRHLSGDRDLVVTTMVDFYALPSSWYAKVGSKDPLRIEQAMAADIGFPAGRFLPFVMMHEFEALLFSDCATLCKSVDHQGLEPLFSKIRADFASPEEINDSPQTAPSKRILALMPRYRKVRHGVTAARAIGLERMRAECPHFSDWLEKLVALRAQL
jgi:Domain of unknown function (DUF4276)